MLNMPYGIICVSFPRMVNYPELLFLGGFSGLTIFLGLPIAVLQGVSPRQKGFLNAVAIGILLFLTVDIFGHAWNTVEEMASNAFAGSGPTREAVLGFVAMFGGVAIGLLGLTWFETRFSKTVRDRTPIIAFNGSQKQNSMIQRVEAYRLSTIIAIGIGAHNFSEGLAIGQSYASGAIELALMLIIGFAAHNATEGFGIAGPLTGLPEKPKIRYLCLAGLVGGGPTFIGTILGSLWASTLVYILFLALAGGALVYVSLLMYNIGRRQTTNDVLMMGLFIGLVAGFVTDLMVTLGRV
jgi:ZIP family zinc transporter